MDIKKIKSLYNFIKDTDIVEIEIEGAEGKIRLRRGEPEVERVEESVVAPRADSSPDSEPSTSANVKTVTSPMVGTFYSAPAPDSPPLVETGTEVRAGEPLCIIEAMKVMNEVQSDFGGKVMAVLVDNGQPVEYGEPLFRIDVQC